MIRCHYCGCVDDTTGQTYEDHLVYCTSRRQHVEVTRKMLDELLVDMDWPKLSRLVVRIAVLHGAIRLSRNDGIARRLQWMWQDDNRIRYGYSNKAIYRTLGREPRQVDVQFARALLRKSARLVRHPDDPPTAYDRAMRAGREFNRRYRNAMRALAGKGG